MDVQHTSHEIQFEWDRAKAEANFVKHHVEFETACEAFFDPFVYVLDQE